MFHVEHSIRYRPRNPQPTIKRSGIKKLSAVVISRRSQLLVPALLLSNRAGNVQVNIQNSNRSRGDSRNTAGLPKRLRTNPLQFLLDLTGKSRNTGKREPCR